MARINAVCHITYIEEPTSWKLTPSATIAYRYASGTTVPASVRVTCIRTQGGVTGRDADVFVNVTPEPLNDAAMATPMATPKAYTQGADYAIPSSCKALTFRVYADRDTAMPNYGVGDPLDVLTIPVVDIKDGDDGEAAVSLNVSPSAVVFKRGRGRQTKQVVVEMLLGGVAIPYGSAVGQWQASTLGATKSEITGVDGMKWDYALKDGKFTYYLGFQDTADAVGTAKFDAIFRKSDTESVTLQGAIDITTVADSTVYRLTPSVQVVRRYALTGVADPQTIRVSAERVRDEAETITEADGFSAKVTVRKGNLYEIVYYTLGEEFAIASSYDRLTFKLYRSSDNKLLDTVTIPIVRDGEPGEDGKDGSTGIEGAIPRVTEWSGESFHYSDGTEIIQIAEGRSVRIQDFVYVRDTVASGTHSSGVVMYMCIKPHDSDPSKAPSGTSAGDQTEYWQRLNNMTPIYTPFLLADHAYIGLGDFNAIRVLDNTDKTKVVAALRGADPFLYGGDDVDNPAKAPFRVYKDGSFWGMNAHIKGYIEATDGIFSGTIRAKNGYFSGFVRTSDVAINNRTTAEYMTYNDDFEAWELDWERCGNSVRFEENSNDLRVIMPFGLKHLGATVKIVNQTLKSIALTGHCYKGTVADAGPVSCTSVLIPRDCFIVLQCAMMPVSNTSAYASTSDSSVHYDAVWVYRAVLKLF